MGEAHEVPYDADPEERRAWTARSLSLTTPTTGKESMTELNTVAGRESARTLWIFLRLTSLPVGEADAELTAIDGRCDVCGASRSAACAMDKVVLCVP